MSFSDPEFAAKYEKYMEKQTRVSDWVSQTSSSCYSSTTGSSSTKKSRRPSRASEASSSHRTGIKHSSKPKANHTLYVSPTSTVNPLPAIVGLVSSSLFVMTFLPSILTLLSFALLITGATVMDQREKEKKEKPEC
ncbi:hypothetical protein BJ165DRAFT_1489061 [Panaeolus papilionaceus]|nr:hypothetical protein BJ165DRAFT_1489061 [Panaeolus papilionaceus]